MRKFVSLLVGVSVLVLCLSGLLYYCVVFVPDGFVLDGESLFGLGKKEGKGRVYMESVDVSFFDYEPTNGAISYGGGVWTVKQ